MLTSLLRYSTNFKPIRATFKKMHYSSKRDLIAVIGTTGVGKSQLAVELALSINSNSHRVEFNAGAEIINADSMQIYQGMDVITNKATTQEMRDIPHHLMGFLEPGDEYRVGQFQKDALLKVIPSLNIPNDD